MKTHELKVQPQFWEELICGHMTFQVRRNDRKYSVGDILVMRRYDPTCGVMSEAVVRKRVTCLLHADDMPVAIMPGYVVLGIAWEFTA